MSSASSRLFFWLDLKPCFDDSTAVVLTGLWQGDTRLSTVRVGPVPRHLYVRLPPTPQDMVMGSQAEKIWAKRLEADVRLWLVHEMGIDVRTLTTSVVKKGHYFHTPTPSSDALWVEIQIPFSDGHRLRASGIQHEWITALWGLSWKITERASLLLDLRGPSWLELPVGGSPPTPLPFNTCHVSSSSLPPPTFSYLFLHAQWSPTAPLTCLHYRWEPVEGPASEGHWPDASMGGQGGFSNPSTPKVHNGTLSLGARGDLHIPPIPPRAFVEQHQPMVIVWLKRSMQTKRLFNMDRFPFTWKNECVHVDVREVAWHLLPIADREDLSIDGLEHVMHLPNRSMDSQPRRLSRLLAHTKWIDHTVTLAQLCETTWSTILHSAFNKWISSLLLHDFHRANVVVPETTPYDSPPHGPPWQGDSYKGGLILDALPGFYQGVVVELDFQSAYPSIIQEQSLCFSTLQFTPEHPEGIFHPRPREHTVVPNRMAQLMTARQTAIRDGDGSRATLLKLTNNMLYGHFGFRDGRFCSFVLASAITRGVRESLQRAKETVETLWSWQVLCGHTDSLFALLQPPEGQENHVTETQCLTWLAPLVAQLNQSFVYMKWKVAHVYHKMLIFAKTKYVAQAYSSPDVFEETGTESISGDVPLITKHMFREWMKLIFQTSGCDLTHLPEGHSTWATVLAAQVAQMRKHWLQAAVLADFEIRHKFKGEVQARKKKIPQPHDRIALEWNRLHPDQAFQAGEWVPYVIVKEKTDQAPREKGHLTIMNQIAHPSMVTREEVDERWYLEKSLCSVAVRCFAPLAHLESLVTSRQWLLWWTAGPTWASLWNESPVCIRLDQWRDWVDAQVTQTPAQREVNWRAFMETLKSLPVSMIWMDWQVASEAWADRTEIRPLVRWVEAKLRLTGGIVRTASSHSAHTSKPSVVLPSSSSCSLGVGGCTNPPWSSLLRFSKSLRKP